MILTLDPRKRSTEKLSNSLASHSRAGMKPPCSFHCVSYLLLARAASPATGWQEGQSWIWGTCPRGAGTGVVEKGLERKLLRACLCVCLQGRQEDACHTGTELALATAHSTGDSPSPHATHLLWAEPAGCQEREKARVPLVSSLQLPQPPPCRAVLRPPPPQVCGLTPSPGCPGRGGMTATALSLGGRNPHPLPGPCVGWLVKMDVLGCLGW